MRSLRTDLISSHRRTSAITVNFLNEFKGIISNTTSDLDEHLQAIDSKLQALSSQGPRFSDDDVAERQRIQEERDSTQQCLSICTQVYNHIDQVQSSTFEDVTTPHDGYQEPTNTFSNPSSARLFTSKSFKTCRMTLDNSSTWLKSHLQDLDDRLLAHSSRPRKISNEQAAEQEAIQEEIDSVKQCLTICAQASAQADQDRSNIFEDVSMGEDSQQVIVSTIGDLISAKRVTAGARSTQLMGQMSDGSLQHFSRNGGHIATKKAKGLETGIAGEFKDRHGEGVKLSSRSLSDVSAPRMPP